MDASLDNANNPFTNSNGATTTDNIHLQKQADGLMLNLTDNFKTNGTDHPSEIFVTEKSNGKRSTSEFFHDEDFGPETDVDASEEAVFSPVEKTKSFGDGLTNNNPLEDTYNPFLSQHEKATLETDTELERHQNKDFEDDKSLSQREETPTPPADSVHGPTDLEENPADSDSEDEWNYIKGDEAKKGTLSSQPETVVECSEEDTMSQLNPNAAEFVPVSPTRSIPSPACRALVNDEVISQSPKRVMPLDISVPNETDFEKEVKSRPSDVDTINNGHDSSDGDLNVTPVEHMENLLNGKNIDDIPEFLPGNTPTKVNPNEEFHFGPNAAPFTPKLLDQSEAALSTKAVFGDESVATLDTSFCESNSELNKENQDPLSMSFSADRGDSNPFDLNRVQLLPENLDDFLKRPEAINNDSVLDDTISDLPEHFPLGRDNDNAIKTTDLDKLSQDDEKELASPLEPDLLDVEQEESVSKSPEPTQENLLGDFGICEKPPVMEVSQSLLPIESAVSEGDDLLEIESSSIHGSASPANLLDLPESKSSVCESIESKSPISELLETKSPLLEPQEPDFESKSPELDIPESKSPLDDFLQSESPICEPIESKLPVCDFPKSPVIESIESKSPACELETQPPVCELPEANSPVCELLPPETAIEQIIDASIGEGTDLLNAESPVCGFKPNDVFGAEPVAKSPDLELLDEKITQSPILACEYRAEPLLEFSEVKPEHNLVCDLEKVEEKEIDTAEHKSLTEDITSSVKDDMSSPIQDLSPPKSPEKMIADDLIEVQDEEISSSRFDEENLVKVKHEPVEQKQLLQEVSEIPSNKDDLEIHVDVCPISAKSEPQEQSEEMNEQICIKTENIAPEFAEQTVVITPSEENKPIVECPTAAPEETLVKEPIVEEKGSCLLENLTAATPEIVLSPVEPREVPVEKVKEVTASLQETKDVKKDEKKAAAVPSKKPTGKVAPSKTTPKAPVASKTTPKPAPSPKVPAKMGTARTPTASSKTLTAAKPELKPSPKPKTAAMRVPAQRLSDSKPLTNGDLKPTQKTSLPSKKSNEATATRTVAKSPASSAPKTSFNRMAASRPATTIPKATAAPKTTTSRPATAPAAKPKPPVPATRQTATPRTVTQSTAKTTANESKAPPKPATITSAKPRTITSAPKPRVPLTKTVAKSADVEKQHKDSVNKLTAARTITKTSALQSNTKTTSSTTVKRTEVKQLANRTATKTTTTTTKSTLGKKPGEVKTISKTKTTKIEKPKENGITATVVTEEITMVNNVVNDSENQLQKDNSPLDNKLIVENALMDANPADFMY